MKVEVQSFQNGNGGHLGLRVSRKLSKKMWSYMNFYIYSTTVLRKFIGTQGVVWLFF